MNIRIKMIRQAKNMTQSQFAAAIGLSRNYIAMIEMGQREPSDRTISDICREFNVCEDWIRTGTEPMFMPAPEDDTEYINELLSELDNPFTDIIKSIMSVYMELSPEDREKVKAFAASLSNKMQKENRD